MTVRININGNVEFEQINNNPLEYKDVNVFVAGNGAPIDGNIRYLTVENIQTCGEGWTYFGYTNMCYKLIPELLTWNAAFTKCFELTDDKVLFLTLC